MGWMGTCCALMGSSLNRDENERGSDGEKLTTVKGLEGLLKLKLRSSSGKKGNKVRRL